MEFELLGEIVQNTNSNADYPQKMLLEINDNEKKLFFDTIREILALTNKYLFLVQENDNTSLPAEDTRILLLLKACEKFEY